MAIRVTQQYTEVFGPASGKLRVSRQYIEVLHEAGSANINASATSTLSFVSTALGKILEQTATSNLGVTDAAIAARDQEVSASSTLAFTQHITKTTPASATSNLGLYHTWFEFNYVDDRKVGESTLNLSQVAHAFGFDEIEHDLGLTDEVIVRGPVLQSTSAQLTFTQATRNSEHHAYATDDLGITDTAQYPLPTQCVTSTLNLTDLAYMSFINDVIAFTQVAIGGRSPGVQHQIIVFTQAVRHGGTFRRTIIDALGIGHSLTYFENSPCNRKNYTPFMGEGTGNTPSATLNSPQFDTSPGDAERFLLYYPARGARATTVSIRAPEFGDRNRNAYTRVNRETRGGRLIVFADPNWPQVRTLAVTIIGLLKTEVDEIQSLFYAHLGQLIGITDWEGHEWEGVITDPEQPAVHDGKRGWTITFQFEGQIIDGYSPGHDLGVDGTAGDAKDPGANSPLTLIQELGGSQPTPDAPAGQDLGFISAAAATVVTP